MTIEAGSYVVRRKDLPSGKWPSAFFDHPLMVARRVGGRVFFNELELAHPDGWLALRFQKLEEGKINVLAKYG